MNPDAHTLTGAYALNALEETERREFEAHLAECPACAREVDELSATAARLALAAAVPAPDRLRQRVRAQVATTRQEPPSVPPVPLRVPARHRPGGWMVRLTAAVAAVAAVAAGVLGVAVTRSEHERDLAHAELARLQAQYEPLARLAAAPDARAATGSGVGGGTAFVLTSHALDQAVLVTSDLPTPPSGHAYQAWLIGTGRPPRSIGLVPPAEPTGPTAAAPLVFTGLDGAAEIGLTVEPAGGSPQPTTAPVVLFDLPTT